MWDYVLTILYMPDFDKCWMVTTRFFIEVIFRWVMFISLTSGNNLFTQYLIK